MADVLADGPRTGREVAATVGADPDALTRMLRGLVLEDVLAEDGDGRFALTAVGEGLREGVPGSQRGAILVRGEVYWSAAAGMLRTAIDGGTAFEHVHGERFFEHLAADPEREAAFQASMADRARREAADVVAVYDFAGLRELVDVGGGSGVLLEAILRATPGLRGVLDRPARRRWSAPAPGSRPPASTASPSAWQATSSTPSRPVPTPTCSRVSCTTGTTPTPGGSSRRAARPCPPTRACCSSRRSCPSVPSDGPGGHPDGSPHADAAAAPASAREAQFRELLAGAGFDLRRVVPTASAAGLSVLEATVASGAR